MPAYNEIRADYDKTTITVYQAYSEAIAKPALEQQKFVSPFSFNRMTWIKPSFLWMMERCGWGQKGGQEVVLAIRIHRTAWEDALSQAVLTHPDPAVYPNAEAWQARFKTAKVHVQWDPERSIRGGKLEYHSIQVGISRHLIQQYAKDWIVEIKDYRPLVKKIYELKKKGEHDHAKKHLPTERVYPLPPEIGKQIGIT